jgi:hypothetical protein
MNWEDLLAAFALYLVIEGAMPFLSPEAWRRGLALLGQLADKQLRLFGLGCMGAGLLLLVVVRSG